MRVDDFLSEREIASLGEDVADSGFLCVERVGFFPNQPRVTTDRYENITLNTWRSPRWSVCDEVGDPKPFLDLVDHLLDGDERAISHLLDYIAHLVQRPEECVAHAVLLTSEAQGVGKSTLGEIIRRLAGEDNCGVAQPKDLSSAFDSWVVGRLVVQVDEIYE